MLERDGIIGEDPRDCPFCGILEGRVEGFLLKRTKHIAVILSLEGHPLVITGSHISLAQLTPTIAQSLGKEAFGLMGKIGAMYSSSGVNLFAALGRSAGQEVFHAHVHLIPRDPSDKKGLRAAVRRVSFEERQIIAANIKAKIGNS